MKPYRLSPGLPIETITITKTDNINDTDVEGYEVKIKFLNGETVECIEYTIDELEDKPYGIYEFDGKEFIQIENWDE